MKKILLFIASVFSLASANAQSFVSEHGDTVTTAWSVAGSDVSVDNHIKNTTSSDIYIKWKLVGNSVANGWDLSGVCDNNLCYSSSANLLNGTSVQVSNAYTPGNFMDFHALFNGDNAASNSNAWIRVRMDDTINNYSKTYTFIATKGNVGVTNVTRSDDDVVLYPNPARNNLNVIFDAAAGVKVIAIYNLIGKQVSAFRVNGSSAQLDIDNIPAGVYYIRLLNAKGSVIATRRFTHQ